MTPHFTYAELTKTSTGLNNMPAPLHIAAIKRSSMLLEVTRAILKVPLHVNSGFRSVEVNKAVGGSPTSDHLTGNAYDLRPLGLSSTDACTILRSAKGYYFDQLIDYPRRQYFHVSFGARMRQQFFTK